MSTSNQIIRKEFMMSTSSLTFDERCGISILLKTGCSLNRIAMWLDRSESTISSEVSRLKSKYDPNLAQANADDERHHCGRRSTLTPHKKHILMHYLKHNKWDPKTISHVFNIGCSTIYSWFNQHLLSFGLLPEHGKRRRRKYEHRGRITITHSIDQRSEAANKRLEFGDWELDTVLSSPRAEAKACLATFVERQTRFLVIIKIANRTHNSLAKAFKTFMRMFRPTVKTVTTDHGREFSGNSILERKYGVKFYFCHPYSPQERGSNERLNRKVRQFFPKGTNFEKVSQDQIYHVMDLINQKPSEAIDWQKPEEVFYEKFTKSVENQSD